MEILICKVKIYYGLYLFRFILTILSAVVNYAIYRVWISQTVRKGIGKLLHPSIYEISWAFLTFPFFYIFWDVSTTFNTLTGNLMGGCFCCFVWTVIVKRLLKTTLRKTVEIIFYSWIVCGLILALALFNSNSLVSIMCPTI